MILKSIMKNLIFFKENIKELTIEPITKEKLTT